MEDPAEVSALKTIFLDVLFGSLSSLEQLSRKGIVQINTISFANLFCDTFIILNDLIW